MQRRRAGQGGGGDSRATAPPSRRTNPDHPLKLCSNVGPIPPRGPHAPPAHKHVPTQGQALTVGAGDEAVVVGVDDRGVEHAVNQQQACMVVVVGWGGWGEVVRRAAEAGESHKALARGGGAETTGPQASGQNVGHAQELRCGPAARQTPGAHHQGRLTSGLVQLILDLGAAGDLNHWHTKRGNTNGSAVGETRGEEARGNRGRPGGGRHSARVLHACTARGRVLGVRQRSARTSTRGYTWARGRRREPVDVDRRTPHT